MKDPKNELSLIVKIAQKDLAFLPESGFNLCLAKSVALGRKEKYGNVVFLTVRAEDLGPQVDFAWKETYKVFETSEFKDGGKAKADTNVYPLEGGQTATFDKSGIATVTGSVSSGKPLEIENNWRNPARIGVQAYDIETKKYSTIYISPDLPRNSVTQVTPIQKYRLFFDMDLNTEDMFERTGTKPFPFDLNGKSSITIQYEDAEWKVVAGSDDDSD